MLLIRHSLRNSRSLLETKFSGFSGIVWRAEHVERGDLGVAEFWVEVGSEVTGSKDAEGDTETGIIE